MEDNLKKAVALGYKEGDQAPLVLAKGHGFVAEKIIESANRHGVPLVKDPETAMALSTIETGHSIPPELYHVVAKIYSFLLEIDEEMGKMVHEQ